MTDASEFYTQTLISGLEWMTSVVGNKPGADIAWESEADARIFLCAVAGQETDWSNVVQDGADSSWADYGVGPFQLQKNACRLVVANPASAAMAAKMCAAIGIAADGDAVHAALLANPVLSVGFARLLAFCDPRAIPSTESGAWEFYADDVWRPGSPRPDDWPANYSAAVAADAAWLATLPGGQAP